jgi:hypothetical protein
MSQAWKRFLFLQFPLAALALALIAQALAWALSGVVMRRNRTDALAISVLSDPTNYPVVLLADSITRNATARFALGPPGMVANLAAHANFGLVGELLLLQRYLKVHAPPRYVVMVFAPAMYDWVSDIRLVRYSLWHTFTDGDERQFLRTYLPQIGDRDRLPAAADLQVRVVEPLFSLLKHYGLERRKNAPVVIAAGSQEPNPEAPTDTAMQSAAALETATSPAGETATAPINAEALRQLCQLSQRYEFHLALAWPPMATELANGPAASALVGLRKRIVARLRERCQVDDVFDFNSVRTYTMTSFHRDLIHLFGDGWEQRYASDLRGYLTGLADRSTAAAALPRAAHVSR